MSEPDAPRMSPWLLALIIVVALAFFILGYRTRVHAPIVTGTAAATVQPNSTTLGGLGMGRI